MTRRSLGWRIIAAPFILTLILLIARLCVGMVGQYIGPYAALEITNAILNFLVLLTVLSIPVWIIVGIVFLVTGKKA